MKTLHRLALLAYPRTFRHEFGGELQRVFEHRVAAAAAASRVRRVSIGVFLIADAVVSGIAERIRRPLERWAWPRHRRFEQPRKQLMTWESLRADVRLAWRQAIAAPLFAALIVASLAIGIGANSAIFTVVNSVLLQPLPYADAGALVTIWSDNTLNGEKLNPVSPANFEAFRGAPSLAGVEGLYSFLTPLQIRIGSGEPEPALASQVTPQMLALLGRAPILGRLFEGDNDAGGAVITYGFWQRRFGGDRGVVGRPISIAGAPTPLSVIGVMPEDFTFPYGSMLGPSGFTRDLNVDLWVTMNRQRDPRLVDASGQPNRAIHYFAVVGRLRPGASIATARKELVAIAAQRAQQFPDTNQGWGVTVRPLHEQTVGPVRPALLILLAGVAIVLLITCINVANVLLARAAIRTRDLAIRSALGASRARLIQQTLTESVLLSLLGGAVGIVVMVITTRALLAAAPGNLPRLGEVKFDTTVLLFAVGLSFVTGLLVGIFPASAASRSNSQDSLRDGARTTASRARRRTRAALIVAEVALAMTLTVGGALLLRSFVAVLGVDPGFNAERLLTMQLAVPERSRTAAALLPFYDELEEKLRALPGVTAVGGTTRLPLGSTQVTTHVEVEGQPVPRAEMPEVEMRRAVFDFFGAMQIPLLRGRTFAREDGPTAQPVAVINAALAERVFRGSDPLGRRVRFGSDSARWLTIVGVVGNIKHGSLEEVSKPELYIYYRQGAPNFPYLVLRTSGDAAALSTAVRQVARNLGADPPTDLRTMEAIRSRSVGTRRFVLLLVGAFAALAVALAALGVFGVITLIAAERTTEVGIRLALGAAPVQVLTLLVTQALKLTVAGVSVGMAFALMASSLLTSQLFGVEATDPLTFASVALLLLLTAAVAAYLPARRAMQIDPAAALRVSSN